MARSLREIVRQRANSQCEYCRLPDFATPAFHIDHIIAKQHKGQAGPENRAWTCHRCNLHKGPNLTGIDPLTGKMARLFHPRLQSWNRHFAWQGALLVGRTSGGRATIDVLDMNDPQRVELRLILLAEGIWPVD